MKPMYKPKPQLFPGWLCATIVALGLLAMAMVTMSGCASLDKVAEDGQRLGNDPAVQDIAGTIPYGSIVLNAATGIAAIYLAIRKRAWKTAFTAVVNSVDPYIPADEQARAKLQAAQGQTVTKLVKSVKAETP